jgi:hypothetical protein
VPEVETRPLAGEGLDELLRRLAIDLETEIIPTLLLAEACDGGGLHVEATGDLRVRVGLTREEEPPRLLPLLTARERHECASGMGAPSVASTVTSSLPIEVPRKCRARLRSPRARSRPVIPSEAASAACSMIGTCSGRTTKVRSVSHLGGAHHHFERHAA